ncbi:hypothetical protein BDD12DRAFT_441900 [Trichophaea hybrida]|nr:hypothetical protein BDD12DRAFT_441900 [Trichophaea hybrida]
MKSTAKRHFVIQPSVLQRRLSSVLVHSSAIDSVLIYSSAFVYYPSFTWNLSKSPALVSPLPASLRTVVYLFTVTTSAHRSSHRPVSSTPPASSTRLSSSSLTHHHLSSVSSSTYTEVMAVQLAPAAAVRAKALYLAALALPKWGEFCRRLMEELTHPALREK